ncbi:type IV secretion system protein [Brucella sp. NBRC 12950]|uniref:type IV secretion system protein n=1 Tax=Brucella sp. NBRC 12950 TaxID=2994518 RepID=UPI002556BB39|nr:type IV secretion system protein [Brucella sp. NBRC 12950]
MSDGLVASYVASATTMLGKANEAGFSSLSHGISAIAIAVATIAFVTAIFNQFMQIGYMSPSKMLALMMKLILISYIGLKWGNFSLVASAVENGMNSIASSLLETVSSGGRSSPSLAGSIDQILSSMATASNKALMHTGWITGSILTILVVTCLATLGAVSALIIIYSKIMISVFIMIAPPFICCLIFERTSDYFYRWLQGAITYALYPVITSAVMALIAGITNSYIESMKASSLNTITEFIPFITVVGIAVLIIIFIPTIVSGLTGMIQHVSPLHLGMPIMQALTSKKKDNNDDNSPRFGDRTLASSPSPQRDPAAKSPSGPFPGEPSRALARDERILGKSY